MTHDHVNAALTALRNMTSRTHGRTCQQHVMCAPEGLCQGGAQRESRPNTSLNPKPRVGEQPDWKRRTTKQEAFSTTG